MRVGFIGAGRIATTIGRHLGNAGPEIVLSGSHGLAGFVADLAPAASAGSKQQAANCDVVVLACAWVDVPEALRGIDWRGRILADGVNAQAEVKPDLSAAGVATSVAALDLLNSTGLVALDLGSLAAGGAMQQLGGPLSGVKLHSVRRLVRKN